MRKREDYCGLFPAFYAGYDSRGEVSPSAVRSLTRYLIKKGIKGTYVCGSSGECIYQSVAERKKTLEAVMEEAQGSPLVIAHVAANNTRDSIELAAHAQSLGVDAIAAIPPIYFHLSDSAIADYWNAISSAAPDTPFLIYHIPALAGVSLSLPLLRTMRENPRLFGVKCSSPLPQDILQFKNTAGQNLVVYNGTDEQYAAGFAMGADGGIGGTYAVMPELFIRLDSLLKAGNIPAAVSLQRKIDDVISLICGGRSNLYAVMKEVLLRRDGIDLGGVRAPLPALFPEDSERVNQVISLIQKFIGE